MVQRDVNHTFWQLQYESNLDKGLKDSLNFRALLTAQVLVKAGIIHAGIFAYPGFVEDAFKIHSEFLISPYPLATNSDLSAELRPCIISAPMDDLSMQNAIKSEYINLIKKHHSKFAFTLIHFVPLNYVNNDRDNDWIKENGKNVSVQKKLNTWINNKSALYLNQTLTAFLDQELKANNIENNFDCPLFLITNVDLDKNAEPTPTENILVYVGLIDNQTKKITWVRASQNYFVRRTHMHYEPSNEVNPDEISVFSLINGKDIKIENDSFVTFSVSKDSDGKKVYHMLQIFRDHIYRGNFTTLVLDQKALPLTDKNLPQTIEVHHKLLYDWVAKVHSSSYKNN